MEIISRAEAQERGLKRYFTGNACPHGHVSERLVANRKCHKCGLEATRRWAIASREHLLEYRRRRYAASPEVRAAQRRYDGLPTPARQCPDACECCGGPPTGIGSLHLDHCHSADEFRGWLCQKCNHGIGLLGDSKEGLLRAIAYLDRVARAHLKVAA